MTPLKGFEEIKMHKAERLNQELIFLSNKNTFRVNDLTTEFQISKRTALRDISELEAMGLSFYVEAGRYGGYHLLKQELLIPITFNLEEVNAIFFAINALSLLSATPFEKSYQHIYDKLMATLPNKQQIQVQKLQQSVSYYKVPSITAPNFLNIILQSILEEKALNITYHQFQIQRQQLQVYSLLYRHGIWFCDAYDLINQKWGTYRCDCIEECTLATEVTQTFSHQELQKFQQQYEQTYHDTLFECTLTPLGKELFQKNNYPNMNLKEENGLIILYGGYNQAEFDYMIQYLIAMGPNVTINYPETLKQAYLDELRKIIEKY